MNLDQISQEQLDRLKQEQIINAYRKKPKKIKTIKVKATRSRDLVAEALAKINP
jgi:hypothetical protein